MKKLAVILLLFFSGLIHSQEELTRILFVFDASNSMNQRWGSDTRLNIAKDILMLSVDSLNGSANLELGLRIYGHQHPVTATYQNCEDTKLEVPFSPNNYDQIKNRIYTIRAKGTTPIARSLEAAAGDFPDNNSRNVIILITDGIEACDDEPCVIADKLRAKGVTISPFVIGLGLDMSYLDHFDCFGKYSSAETEEEFSAILKNVINKALVNTTVQINLNTIEKNPFETDVTMFLYEAGTKDLIYTFTHTMNEANLPDTLIIDPNKKYDLVVNTLPKQTKKNISIQKNTHNTIEVDAPQGILKVGFKQRTRTGMVDVRVMQEGNPKTLNTQKIDEIQKYIVGTYDVEVLTLPRRYFKADIKQSQTNFIQIDAPGTLNLKSLTPVTGQIFEIMEDGSFEWVCNLDEKTTSDSWRLQPGKYRLVYRKKELKSSAYTVERDFYIYSNKSISINL